VKDIRVGEILLFCAFIVFTNIAVLNAETNQTKREVPFTLEDRDRIIRIETKLSEMEKRFNERFEQIDKRFEDINKRFDQMMTFMWILASVFAGIVAVTISFAIWDRRTMIRPFEEKVKKIEKEIATHEEKIKSSEKEIMESKEKLSNLISALKDLAKDDEKLAEILKKFNLL